MEVIILVGIPASGKSTFAKEWVKTHESYVIISRDMFRYGLQDKGFCTYRIEQMISKLVDDTIVTCLENDLNLIIDNTNLKADYINHFYELVNRKASIRFKVFDIPVEECIKRDELRERKVGREVIYRMNKAFKEFKDTFDFQPIPKGEIALNY